MIMELSKNVTMLSLNDILLNKTSAYIKIILINDMKSL